MTIENFAKFVRKAKKFAILILVVNTAVNVRAGPVGAMYFTGFNFTDMALKAVNPSPGQRPNPEIVTIGPDMGGGLSDTHHDAWMDSAPQSRQIITGALNSFASRTGKCIQFIPRTNQQDYIYIQAGYGCYSHVGRVGGRQTVSLGRGCVHHEVAVHELMHSLGFWHEQSRSDRDNHIRILWQNIRPGTTGNFAKIDPRVQTLLGEPYDFQSVMHYQPKAFTVNGQRTIEALDPQYTKYLGTAKQASDLDLVKIKKLYGCDSNIFPTPSTVVPTTARPTTRRQTTTTTTDATTTASTSAPVTNACRDNYNVCGYIQQYCFIPYLSFIMQESCSFSCGYCN